MKHLKELRQSKGVSQQVVADYLEITRQAYSNYENGNRAPDTETLLKLGEYFGVSVDTILRGKEKAPAENGERSMSDSELKFALFGDCDDVTDDDLADVRRYAAFVLERKKDLKK